MDINNILNNFHFFEVKSKFESYEVIETPNFRKNHSKMLMSGLKKAQKATLNEELSVVKIAFQQGTEISLPVKYKCHEWAQSDSSKNYTFGDFHLSYGYIVKWIKYKEEPKVEFTDIGNHANTGAA